MRKKNLVKLISMVLALVVFSAINVSSAQIFTFINPATFTEDCETFSGYVNTASGGKSCFVGMGSNVSVLTTKTDSNNPQINQYLEVKDHSNNGFGRANIIAAGGTTGPSTWSFNIRVPDYTIDTKIPFVKIGFNDRLTANSILSDQKEVCAITFIHDDNGDLQLQVNDGTSFKIGGTSVDVDLFDPLEFDTWYTFTFDVDPNTAQYTFTVGDIDGTPLDGYSASREVKTNTTGSSISTTPLMGGIIIGAGASAGADGDPVLHFDNVRITRNQFAVVDLPVISDITEGNVTATATVTNDLPLEATSPVLVLALYDAKGKLIGITTDSKAMAARDIADPPPANQSTGSYWDAAVVSETLTCELEAGDAVRATANIWSAVYGENSMIPYITPVNKSLITD
ncbi:MAG: hypothetical protein BWY15_00911 [Firmicutes bacterium ADurb.Bin193]|nr:MAG: hypothetical protein BWY15_00911 [Firmicutes bacterium ADurb.Bin193]